MKEEEEGNVIKVMENDRGREVMSIEAVMGKKWVMV